MLLGPIIGGALYSIGGESKEFPFLIMGIPIILDGIARFIIKGNLEFLVEINFQILYKNL
jgi:hypothetical protein